MKLLFRFAACVTLLVAGAGAAGSAWSAPLASNSTKVKFTSSKQFQDTLVSSIEVTVRANSVLTPVALEKTLESTVQNVFVTANVSKTFAKEGVAGAKLVLAREGLYCALPVDGIPTTTCQAVGEALLLADLAIQALTDDGTGDIPATASPPTSGSGGGGGGVTHPPVPS